MNYNHEYNFEKKEDPFSFLKGDDHDFNSSLKGLEDMYNNMMEPSSNQKKKPQQQQQQQQVQQQQNRIAQQQYQQYTPGLVMGVPVVEQNGAYLNHGQAQQYQQHPVQFQQQHPFNQELYVKPHPNNQQQQQFYDQQQMNHHQIPLTNVQFQQQPNNNMNPNQKINYHYQHHQN